MPQVISISKNVLNLRITSQKYLDLLCHRWHWQHHRRRGVICKEVMRGRRAATWPRRRRRGATAAAAAGDGLLNENNTNYGGFWILEEKEKKGSFVRWGSYGLEVARFLRNRGLQFLLLGNHATRIRGSIPEESWFTIPIFWGIVPPLLRSHRAS